MKLCWEFEPDMRPSAASIAMRLGGLCGCSPAGFTSAAHGTRRNLPVAVSEEMVPSTPMPGSSVPSQKAVPGSKLLLWQEVSCETGAAAECAVAQGGSDYVPVDQGERSSAGDLYKPLIIASPSHPDGVPFTPGAALTRVSSGSSLPDTAADTAPATSAFMLAPAPRGKRRSSLKRAAEALSGGGGGEGPALEQVLEAAGAVADRMVARRHSLA